MKQLLILSLTLFTFNCSEKQLYESSNTQTAAVAEAPTQSAVTPGVNYEKYVGVYKMQDASFEEVAVTQENGKLFVQATGERKVEVYAEKENTFDVPAFNAKITFTQQADSAFKGITVLLDGNELQGLKKE